jgi:hypothetical protein
MRYEVAYIYELSKRRTFCLTTSALRLTSVLQKQIPSQSALVVISHSTASLIKRNIMSEENSISSIEKQIEEKTKALIKLKKDIPKMIALVIFAMFILPYFPLRRGRLIDQYGYVNALLFEAAVFIIAIPLVTVFTLRNMEEEIVQLELDLEFKKRLEKINEKEE